MGTFRHSFRFLGLRADLLCAQKTEQDPFCRYNKYNFIRVLKNTQRVILDKPCQKCFRIKSRLLCTLPTTNTNTSPESAKFPSGKRTRRAS